MAKFKEMGIAVPKHYLVGMPEAECGVAVEAVS